MRKLQEKEFPLSVPILNELIKALSYSKRFNEAIQLFHIMQSPNSPVTPNSRTILELISGSGRLRDALLVDYFRQYGVKHCTPTEKIIQTAAGAFLECGEVWRLFPL